MDWLAHDLLQISRFSDLVYGNSAEALCPPWVERSLQEAAFVVVRRATFFDGMVPVGVRGSLRTKRFAAYVDSESELPCRIDAQLETPRGAISLAEYARGETPLLSRQPSGPALVSDPWDW